MEKKLLTEEMLLKGGFVLQEGLDFPFDFTPLYEHPDTKVYAINSMCGNDGSEDEPVWLWGFNDNGKPEGEGTTLDEFNGFLSENGCETLKTSGEE
jgi:hypothetical protein